MKDVGSIVCRNKYDYMIKFKQRIRVNVITFDYNSLCLFQINFYVHENYNLGKFYCI